MSIDFTNPIAFATSAAVLSWLVIETMIKPVLEGFAWWNNMPDRLRSVVLKVMILGALIPWGLHVFGTTEEVILASLGAVLQATGLHTEVKRRYAAQTSVSVPSVWFPLTQETPEEGGEEDNVG